MDKIKVVCLGGLGEDYKNMTVIEINDDIFVVDCGLRLADKTKPGIDYVIARYDYLIENKSRIRAYFLTRGLDSVSAGIAFIYDKVPAPIYCTSTTKLILNNFCKHNSIDSSQFIYVVVNPSDDVVIKNRKIQLFSTSCNVALSFGVSFSTDQGNIVIISDFVVHNDQNNGFIHDIHKIAKIVEEKTLLLMTGSRGVERSGYCSPFYRLLPYVERQIRDAQGRIFLAVDTPDFYNIADVLHFAIKQGRKIVPYDGNSRELLETFVETGFLKISRDSWGSLEDVNRARPQELLIFMTGYGNKLNSKISLLATRKNDERIVFLTPNDTFIFGSHVTDANETSATEALDELYRNDCTIIRPSRKNFVTMHACEEDLKAMLLYFKPKYFIPIAGSFKQLLSSAKIAVNMNIGLNHTNIFVLENGNTCEFDGGIGRIISNRIITGDLFIDGKGVGDIGSMVIEERQKFSDDGVIILAATISKRNHIILGTPDVQTRGLIYMKEGEALIREITALFINCIEQELAKSSLSIAYLEANVKDIVFKAIRRSLNKSPIIIPIIAQID